MIINALSIFYVNNSNTSDWKSKKIPNYNDNNKKQFILYVNFIFLI